MTDPLDSFLDHLRAFEIAPADPSEIIADDKRRRYRLDGDKPTVKNGSYQLKIEADGFAVGWALSFREGVTHPWHTKSARKADPEERAAWKKKTADAKLLREADTIRLNRAAADKAKSIWARASTTGETEYLTRKNCSLNGARVWNGLVVVPMYAATGIVGAQFIQSDGAKRFLKGMAKEGSYFPITTKDEAKDVIVICEGFATAAAIRTATGWPVVAAFDAGNLKPVAVAMRKKYPDARIIIGADNDQWRSEGNIGVEKANQAAVAIGGAQVIKPFVPDDDAEKRTDWDDILRSEGADSVREAFMSLPEPDYDQPDYEERDYMGEMPEVTDDTLAKIRPLGHNRGLYSFFPRAAGQIVTLSATGLGRVQSLYMLAPRGFWERQYGGEKVSDSAICAFASAHLMEACHNVGVFQPETTRGVGAWMDGGVPVINCGDAVIKEGNRTHPAEFEGEAVYESGPRVVHTGTAALSNAEAAKALALIRRLQWKRPQYAYLLAGWLVLAPVGGALTWRPHIWITGKSGSGKSTVINEVAKKMLGDVGLSAEGATEAKVRGAIGQSTRPFVLDEAESETAQARLEIQKIINFARKCSSGGIVANANAIYRAQSCFLFAAINPSVEQLADTARISIIELARDSRPDRLETWNALLSDMREVFTTEYCRAMQARTMENLPALLDNIATFTRVATKMFGDSRAGDQLGPMIAGAFSLTSTSKISDEAATAWMQKQDWDWHTQTRETEDSAVLLTHIMTSRIRYDHAGMMRESTIGDMVALASEAHSIGQEGAVSGLRSYGIKVDDGRLIISNTAPQLRRILADTPYVPWARGLSEIPGAIAEKPVYFMVGLISRAVSFPLSAVTGDTEPVDEDLPFDLEDVG
jgi:putative DNA primase/helicase